MIGNSFTYYGKCVLQKGRTVLEQEPRDNDKGYFYRLCKSDGAFDFGAYCERFYTYEGAKTNFPDIFASPEDMHGIQLLADKYISEKLY